MSAALISRWSVSSFSRLIRVCATALVVPGSHVWEKAERDKFFGTNLGHDSPLVAQAVMPKGSCLVFSGNCWHGSGENRSERTRYGLNIDYSVAWLRQEKNQVPPQLSHCSHSLLPVHLSAVRLRRTVPGGAA